MQGQYRVSICVLVAAGACMSSAVVHHSVTVLTRSEQVRWHIAQCDTTYRRHIKNHSSECFDCLACKQAQLLFV